MVPCAKQEYLGADVSSPNQSDFLPLLRPAIMYFGGLLIVILMFLVIGLVDDGDRVQKIAPKVCDSQPGDCIADSGLHPRAFN